MNTQPQPRFKFGDKVISTATGKTYEVFLIRKNNCSDSYVYYPESYSDKWSGGDDEESLELLQEPQKKKLYAYRMKPTGEIKFFDSEQEGVYGLGSEGLRIDISKFTFRAESLDIEFPEAK